MLATAAVENGPNLITGATIADLFADLAQRWRGWSGQKVWENNEHTLRLAATHDGLGHIRIEVHLTKYAHAEWEACGSIALDAGELADLARRASTFDQAQAGSADRQPLRHHAQALGDLARAVSAVTEIGHRGRVDPLRLGGSLVPVSEEAGSPTRR
ncbi:MAG TPA: DUF6228 family protein [Solirubrobacteraceae bacterium]